MRRQHTRTLIISILLWAMTLGTQAVELTQAGATLAASYGSALQNSAQANSGTTLESALDLRMNTRWAFSDAVDLFISARARLDGERRYTDPEDSFSSYAHPGRPRGIGKAGYAELDEAYIELSLENAQFRFGKQQIVWGALDGLKVTDVLNPQRFREFILEPFDESRIATFSAYGDLTLGNLRLELAWLPDETTHDLAQPGDWFEFRAPRFRLGAAPAEQAAGNILTGNPGSELGRGAIRLSRSFGSVGVSAIAAHTLDYEPTAEIIQRDAGSTLIQRNYHSMSLYGLTVESAVGALVLRAETAYRPNRRFNLRSAAGLTTRRLDNFSAAIAADINGPWDTFINVQFLYDKVQSRAPIRSSATAIPAALDDSTLVRPAQDRLFTAFVRKQFLYDTLTVDLRWYTDLDVKDGLYRAQLSYALGDNTTLSLSVDSFYSAGNASARERDIGLFGQFANRDRASATITYTL